MTLLFLFGSSGVTQTVTLQSTVGLTGHSIRLKSVLGVTLATVAATELSDGIYGADFTDVAAGFAFVQFIRDSDGAIVSFGSLTLTSSTDTFPVQSSGGGGSGSGNATLAKQDEILAAIDTAVQEVSAVMIENSGEAY